ncbi:hypothetical protein JW859_03465 [bacterium]|nr:hypothetical protein [bacterium]
MELLLWLVLILLAMLAGAVLYLLTSRRHYQRVDYSQLIEQEEERRRMAARVERLEQLLARLVEYDRQRRAELGAFIDEAKTELAAQIKQAHRQIAEEILSRPAGWDQFLLDRAGVEPPGVLADDADEKLTQVVNFKHGSRQFRIAELLELGFTPQEVSRELGVSRHEVELISAMIFKTKSA